MVNLSVGSSGRQPSQPISKVLLVKEATPEDIIYTRYLQSDPHRQYQVLTAATGAEGIELWRSQRPDVVLLDLPSEDELSFLELFPEGGKKQPSSFKVPVVVLIEAHQEQLAEQALQLGAMDYLVKDAMTSLALRQRVAAVVEYRGVVQQLTQTEQQLLQSETKLQAILNFSPSVIYVKDLEGRHTWVNQAFLNLFGCTHADIVGKTDREIFPPDIANVISASDRRLLETGEFQQVEETIPIDNRDRAFLSNKFLLRNTLGDVYAICSMSMEISGRKQADLALQESQHFLRQQAAREQLKLEITQRIRQSLDLQTIFDTACEEIRQVIQSDRVGIFKFYPETYDDGEFVAESVVEGYPSALRVRIHDHCFGENYSTLYAQGRYFVVNDIYNNGLQICHSNILAQFAVRANLVMPLHCGEDLWGLLCVHQCSNSRQWQPDEIELTHQLASQLAIAIQQANLYYQIQQELEVRQRAEIQITQQLKQQQALANITKRIRESLNLENILATLTQQVKAVMECDRVIVFRLFPDGRSRIVEEAVASGFTRLKDQHWEDEVWSLDILKVYWQGNPRIVPDVMDDIWTDCLRDYSREGQIQSKIVAPILQEVSLNELHRWVAPGSNNKLWGILVVHACREKRVWQDSEAQLLQQVANQLAIAIQQANLFDQLQKELAQREQTQAQLTERNEQLAVSNAELAHATRLKDEFLANMSHELRTPLTAILGLTEGLQEEVFGMVTERQLQAFKIIERTGNHLLSLINDILDVAKIEAGQIELDRTSVSAQHLCESSLVFIKQQAIEKRLQLIAHIPDSLPYLFVDERRIRQVLINLLNNAVKFTPQGGQITLEVSYISALPEAGTPMKESESTHHNCLQFAITDTGIGISQENMQKLFQPFMQIDSALNRQYEGTGLGLTLVKRLVELHGGQVSLTSQVGVGSCFAFTLPLANSVNVSPRPDVDSEVSDENPSSATLETAPLILLAEDNEANIATIVAYLEAKGYRILLAKNGQTAIALAQSEHPDLILMDISMPGMDGIEAMRRLRSSEQLAAIPIIALTALTMPGDRERCLLAGANDYLSKPVKLKRLTEVIQQWLATER